MSSSRKVGRLLRGAVVASLLAVVVAGSVPEARALTITLWRGRTTQDLVLKFTTLQQGRARFVDGGFVEFKLRCAVTGEVQRWLIGFFADPGFPIRGGEFDIEFADPFAEFTFAGTIEGNHATGTTSFKIAELVPDDGAQLCSSGVPGWAAAPRETGDEPAGTHRIEFRRDASGRTTVTRSG